MSKRKWWQTKRFKRAIDYKRHKNFYDMVSGILIFAAFTAAWWLVFQLADKNLVGGYWTNVITTVGGTVLTIFVLDRWNGNRAIRERKEELILQMGSPDNGFALEAARLLDKKGWFTDGSLIGARLEFANLEGAVLFEAKLQGAKFNEANLQRTNLTRANLQGAILLEANLQGAKLLETNLDTALLIHANLEDAYLPRANLQGSFLSAANLQRANLTEANLQDAWMLKANLKGAFLTRANLQGTVLSGFLQAEFDYGTVLPDGSRWTPERDIREFTDPTHPKFWRSDKQTSPAYRGNAT
jgi:Pentapeptide repeats (8 copies)